MNKLFSNFDTISKNRWLEKINIDVKNEIKKLISKNEDIITHAIYHGDDNFTTYNTNFPSTWETYQLIDASNAKQANKRALDALQNDVKFKIGDMTELRSHTTKNNVFFEYTHAYDSKYRYLNTVYQEKQYQSIRYSNQQRRKENANNL